MRGKTANSMQTVQKDLLPQKQRWSQRAIARHICCDKNTVKIYAEQIAVVIPDFLKECPRNPDGSIKSGMSLSQYQAWVLIKLIQLGRIIKEDLNGTAYRKVIKATAVKKVNSLSKEAFEQETNCKAA